MQGIYKITNIINGNAYIGKSINIENRFKEHKRRALFADTSKEFNKVLYKAIRKYGIENFRFEILEVIEDINLLNSREMFWINYYNTYKKGYNQTIGGDGNKNVSGENHPNHKVSLLDVIDIRKRWAAKKESVRDIYIDYSNKISKTGYKKIYSWQTWKNILPELNTKENRDWHRNNIQAYSMYGESNPMSLLKDYELKKSN